MNESVEYYINKVNEEKLNEGGPGGDVWWYNDWKKKMKKLGAVAYHNHDKGTTASDKTGKEIGTLRWAIKPKVNRD